jgi:7-cyano-7-deazaguanine synthase
MKILVHVSGGLDSAAVLATLAQNPDHEIYPHFINYGQEYASQELLAAAYTINHMGANLFTSQIKDLATTRVPLRVKSNTDVAAYVPYRNLVLAAVSVNLAASLGCECIAVGSKTASYRADDPYSFRDSSWPFFLALNSAIGIGTEPGKTPPRIIMPMLGRTKAQVYELLRSQDFMIERLWSCYEDGPEPCGKCHHCVELAQVKAAHDSTGLIEAARSIADEP